MLSVKQDGIKYHFLSLWNDSTCDWTQVYRVIGEKTNMYLIIIIIWIIMKFGKSTNFICTMNVFCWLPF